MLSPFRAPGSRYAGGQQQRRDLADPKQFKPDSRHQPIGGIVVEWWLTTIEAPVPP
jgi:hypothetical protein